MIKKWLSLFLLALLLTGAPARAQDPPLFDNITIAVESGEKFPFAVELAVTPQAQENGLMNRLVMEEGTGMLFIFGSEEMRSFWMKNTLIPLDIIFLRKDGIIHHIHTMAKPQDETHITSKRPAFAVLEINGGLADKLGIKEGDKVLHPVFRNMLAD